MQPELAAFQRRFVQAIDGPVTGALAVYRNTVIHGAVEALRSNYPVVAQIVGDEKFEGLAVESPGSTLFKLAAAPTDALMATHPLMSDFDPIRTLGLR